MMMIAWSVFSVLHHSENGWDVVFGSQRCGNQEYISSTREMKVYS
jgi:hypothetical protein